MKSHFVAPLVLVAMSLTGCFNLPGWRSVPGSGNIATEDREVSGFNWVTVAGAGELTLAQGNEESLTIQADDNLLPLIQSEVSRGHLSIGPQNVNLRPTQTIRYRLTFKNLNELGLSGSVRAKADTIRTEELVLRISGSGHIEVSHLEARALATHISGSGSTSAAGHADRQVVDISGSGKLSAPDLQCALAEAHISG